MDPIVVTPLPGFFRIRARAAHPRPVRRSVVDQVRSHLLDELRGSWSLYRSGVLRDVYAIESPAQVVFVLEPETAGAASLEVSALPLIAAGAFDVKLIELRPFVNWSMLFSA